MSGPTTTWRRALSSGIGGDGPRRKKVALVLVVAAFLVYNANLRSVTSADTFPTRYLPISIIQEFDLDLDEFPFLLDYPGTAPGSESDLPYFLAASRGHYVSQYPVMPAVLSVPVYLVPTWAGLTEGTHGGMGYEQTEVVGTFLSKMAGSATVAVSVALVFLGLKRLTSGPRALVIALLYAFATSSWSVSSQGLWQSSMSQPLLAGALYLFVRAREDDRYAVHAGIPLALAVTCRPPVILVAAVYFVYVLHRHRSRALAFLAVPTLVGGAVAFYNVYWFDSLMGGYSDPTTRSLFAPPQVEAILGLLVSPSRGLLTLSPVVVPAFAGLFVSFRENRDLLYAYTAAAVLVLLAFYSTWGRWDGAFSYSYRFLVDLLPLLAVLSVPVAGWFARKRWRKGLLVAAALFSVSVQVVGAFFYPCGWYDTPVDAAENPGRFWDWSDPEFVRCLASGPVRPEGLRFLESLAGGD